MKISWGVSGVVLLAAGVSVVGGWELSPAQESGDDVSVAAPSERPVRRSATSAEAPPASQASQVTRLASAMQGEDPFAARSWLPPAPPPVAVVAPPPPPPASAPATAPPLPFAFVGGIEEGPGGSRTFLSANDALYVVSAGDVLEGIYKVESVTPAAVVFIHLPTGERQTLNLSQTP